LRFVVALGVRRVTRLVDARVVTRAAVRRFAVARGFAGGRAVRFVDAREAGLRRAVVEAGRRALGRVAEAFLPVAMAAV
jgi:hypothetical protein